MTECSVWFANNRKSLEIYSTYVSCWCKKRICNVVFHVTGLRFNPVTTRHLYVYMFTYKTSAVYIHYIDAAQSVPLGSVRERGANLCDRIWADWMALCVVHWYLSSYKKCKVKPWQRHCTDVQCIIIRGYFRKNLVLFNFEKREKDGYWEAKSHAEAVCLSNFCGHFGMYIFGTIIFGLFENGVSTDIETCAIQSCFKAGVWCNWARR